MRNMIVVVLVLMFIFLQMIIPKITNEKKSKQVIEAIERMYQSKEKIEDYCRMDKYSIYAGVADGKYIRLELEKKENNLWEGKYYSIDKEEKIIYKNGIFYNLEGEKIKELKNFKLYFQTDTITKDEINVIEEVESTDAMFPSLYAEYEDKNSVKKYLEQFGKVKELEKILISGHNRGEDMGEISFEDSENKIVIKESCGYIRGKE